MIESYYSRVNFSLIVNKVVEGDTPLDVLCSSEKKSDIIPQGYVEYELQSREYVLNSISTILNVNTAVEDVYSAPYGQTKEQLALAFESLRERQESQIINNDDYGLLKNVADSQRIQTRNGAPTPDDMDELITKVWKEPSFFLAHPRAIAAFERECTKRGVPPVTVNLVGGTFITWRGIPIIPTNKLLVDGLKEPKSQSGKTNILLIRTGEDKRLAYDSASSYLILSLEKNEPALNSFKIDADKNVTKEELVIA